MQHIPAFPESANKAQSDLCSENARINPRIYIYIMYIESHPVSYIIDDATHFSSAKYLTNMSIAGMWDALVTYWASISTGLPHTILTDQRSQFRSTFVVKSTMNEVRAQKSGVE